LPFLFFRQDLQDKQDFETTDFANFTEIKKMDNNPVKKGIKNLDSGIRRNDISKAK
jgi:hypothetical protein